MNWRSRAGGNSRVHLNGELVSAQNENQKKKHYLLHQGKRSYTIHCFLGVFANTCPFIILGFLMIIFNLEICANQFMGWLGGSLGTWWFLHESLFSINIYNQARFASRSQLGGESKVLLNRGWLTMSGDKLDHDQLQL